VLPLSPSLPLFDSSAALCVQVPTLCYHGDMPATARQESFAAFVATPAEGQPWPVLVCSDLAARGLDVGVGGVDHGKAAPPEWRME
jgi:hypothetical protein